VNHTLDTAFILFENGFLEFRRVFDINLVERKVHWLLRDVFDSVHGGDLRVVHVIKDENILVLAFDQLGDGVRADVAKASGDEDKLLVGPVIESLFDFGPIGDMM